MKLYLVRHGEAKSKNDDPQRTLTADGLQEVRQVGQFLRPLALDVHAIWHSPKARAQQTAQALAPAVAAGAEFMEKRNLAPDDDVDDIAREIEAMPENLMIVGHLPFLEKLASKLICGREQCLSLDFKRSAVVALERPAPGEPWVLAWMITPEIIKQAPTAAHTPRAAPKAAAK
jgi:phosphohistidine phosphatase